MKSFALFASFIIAAASTMSLAAERAAIGQPAPGFSLQDQTGKTVSLSDFKGQTVVLEWFNPGCPVTVRHAKSGTMKDLAGKYKGQGVVWLGINSTAGADNSTNQKAVEKFSLNYPVLNDSTGTVGKAYVAKTTPHMYIIEKSGSLAYAGAIDSDSSGGKADATNYVAKALDELLAGKAVSTPETKPYGCSVKYAD